VAVHDESPHNGRVSGICAGIRLPHPSEADNCTQTKMNFVAQENEDAHQKSFSAHHGRDDGF
jgi:hypothetical protein